MVTRLFPLFSVPPIVQGKPSSNSGMSVQTTSRNMKLVSSLTLANRAMIEKDSTTSAIGLSCTVTTE